MLSVYAKALILTSKRNLKDLQKINSLLNAGKACVVGLFQ